MKHLIVAATLTVVSHGAWAASSEDFARNLENSFDEIHAAVESCELTSSGDSSWTLTSFRFALEPNASIEISGLAGVTIAPRVELIWEK